MTDCEFAAAVLSEEEGARRAKFVDSPADMDSADFDPECLGMYEVSDQSPRPRDLLVAGVRAACKKGDRLIIMRKGNHRYVFRQPAGCPAGRASTA